MHVKESVEELKALMESNTRDIYSRFEAVSETMESMAGDVAYGTARVIASQGAPCRDRRWYSWPRRSERRQQLRG